MCALEALEQQLAHDAGPQPAGGPRHEHRLAVNRAHPAAAAAQPDSPRPAAPRRGLLRAPPHLQAGGAAAAPALLWLRRGLLLHPQAGGASPRLLPILL